MVKKIKGIIVLLLMIAMALTACGKSNSADNTKADTSVDEEVKPFGEFESMTLSGEAVTEEVFSQADLTMVNIWGTFCSPCINEMPELGELSRDYADRGFQMIGILCDVEETGDETALEIVEKTQADYMHIIASEDLVNGILSQVYAVPTTIFVDKDGNQIGEAYSGAQDKTTWQMIIEKMLVQVQ